MITKNNRLVSMGWATKCDLTQNLEIAWKDIPAERLPVIIDETALNKAQSSVAVKQAEIAALREEASSLEATLHEKRFELKELLTSVQLGEAGTDEVSKQEAAIKKLSQRLAEIQSQTADTVPALEVHQRTLEVLQERRKQAVYEQRQRMYRDHSEQATAKLKKIMQLAKQMDSEIQGFCSTAKSMMVSEIMESKPFNVPIIEEVLHYTFYTVEQFLSHGTSSRLPETDEEKREKRQRQLQTV